jgi:hypothetical protein
MPILTDAFQDIASALADAAKEKSAAAAAAAAERCGLIELGHGKPSQHTTWERRDGDEILRFEWRWYDQSKPFSIQPDMNILGLTLLRAGQTVRSVEHRYED